MPLTIARRGTGEAPVDAAALPPHMRGAFIAIEDRRFTDRLGIDPRGTRAFWYNFRPGAMVQGGSTITQHCGGNRRRVGHGAEKVQFLKNLCPDQERPALFCGGHAVDERNRAT